MARITEDSLLAAAACALVSLQSYFVIESSGMNRPMTPQEKAVALRLASVAAGSVLDT